MSRLISLYRNTDGQICYKGEAKVQTCSLGTLRIIYAQGQIFLQCGCLKTKIRIVKGIQAEFTKAIDIYRASEVIQAQIEFTVGSQSDKFLQAVTQQRTPSTKFKARPPKCSSNTTS